MSTLSAIRMKVRFRTRDRDHKNQARSTPEIDQMVREKYLARYAMLPPVHVSTASAFTISAGGDTFTVTLTGTTYADAGDIRIRLRSDGSFLEKKSVEQIDALRSGHATVSLGVPDAFCVWEDKAGVLNGRCWPGAKDAQVCDLYRDEDADVLTSATDLDAVAVILNDAGQTALAALVAADIIEQLTDEELIVRKINPAKADKVAASMRAEAEAVFYQEACRRHDVESVGRIERWVSS